MTLHALRNATVAALSLLSSSLALAPDARADGAPAPAPAAAPAPVSDAVFRAVVGRQVELRMLDGQTTAGQLLHLEAESAVLALPEGRVVAVARAQVLEVRLAANAPSAAQLPSATDVPRAVAKEAPRVPDVEPVDRHFGLQFGLGPGILVADLAYGAFYGFLSGSLALPMYSLGTNNNLGGVTLAPGISFKMATDRNWRFDLFLSGSIGYYGHNDYNYWDGSQTRWTSVDGSIGVGVGFHYTSQSGLTAGFKVPVIGFAFGRDVNSLQSSGLYHYLNTLVSYPVATLGYRF